MKIRASRLFLYILVASLYSCEINPIREVYRNTWRANLEEEVDINTPVFFGGLDQFPNADLVVLKKSVSDDFQFAIQAIRFDESGDILQESTLEVGSFDVRLDASPNPLTTRYHGMAVDQPGQHLFFEVNSSLLFTESAIDLAEPLSNVLIQDEYFGVDHIYFTGLNIGQPGYSAWKITPEGEVRWNFEITGRPIDIVEGTDEVLFLLSETETGYLLNAYNEDGQYNYSFDLNDKNLTSPITEAGFVFVSRSNTATVFARDEEGQLVVIFVDPLGRLLFDRSYAAFNLEQLSDFIITKDGGFMMTLRGNDPTSGPAFLVVRLNHRASVTWQSDYNLSNRPSSIELLETLNGDVIIVTDTGSIFNITPD